MSDTAGDAVARPADTANLSALGLSALGVVFGDIGTSPLYTFKTVLGLTGGTPDAVVTLGVLSLVIWTLIVVTTIKYVSVAMRVDNDGEGGILALMSLLGVKRQHRPMIIAFGLFGAALIYGDGAITPAISVLSALEGSVNWLLMLVTLGLTVGFGKSDNLASVAVSATMLMTSALLFIAMREIWGWSLVTAGAVAGVFMLVDAGFFAANFAKVAQGGYVPLILAGLVYGVMLIWHLGATAVVARLQDAVMPVGAFMAKIAEGPIPRVPGTAVFLTRTERDVPPVLVWHVKHNRALHENLFVLTVSTGSTPWVKDTARLTFGEIAPRFWRAAARYGFMERPDIPALLQQAHERGCAIDLSDVTFYVGHETVVPGEDEKALPRWVEALFAFMQRNSAHLTEYFKLPVEAVVEIGREVSI